MIRTLIETRITFGKEQIDIERIFKLPAILPVGINLTYVSIDLKILSMEYDLFWDETDIWEQGNIKAPLKIKCEITRGLPDVFDPMPGKKRCTAAEKAAMAFLDLEQEGWKLASGTNNAFDKVREIKELRKDNPDGH